MEGREERTDNYHRGEQEDMSTKKKSRRVLGPRHDIYKAQCAWVKAGSASRRQSDEGAKPVFLMSPGSQAVSRPSGHPSDGKCQAFCDQEPSVGILGRLHHDRTAGDSDVADTVCGSMIPKRGAGQGGGEKDSV
jgi:hypothetical protein